MTVHPRGARPRRWSLVLMLGIFAGAAAGQEAGVSRKEFEELKAKYEALQQEVSGLRQSTVTQDEVDDGMDELADEIEEYLRTDIDLNAAGRPGTTSFLLAGYATAGYINQTSAGSTFGANLNPLLLWKLTDKLFFEGEFELDLEDGETEIGLEYAQILYTPNDWLTIGGGKFLSPLGIFFERLHPTWINKLPDKPLGYGEGVNQLVPSSQVGFQARGAWVFKKRMRLTVAVFVANGPSLVTDDSETYGQLDFNNFPDSNNSKAFGGRIGFAPIPAVEFGYSLEVAQATPSGSGVAKADVLLQVFDASLHMEKKSIHGTIDVRFEFLYSDVDNVTYDPTGGLAFGPVSYRNRRTAWYVQIAYRPTLSGSAVLKNFEFVYRFDQIDHPRAAPSGLDESRSTLGLNYWLGASSVVKIAVRIADTTGGPDNDAFLLQWAIGF